MYLKSVILFIVFLLLIEVSKGFLMEDLLTKKPTTSAVTGSINNQVSGSLNDRYLQDLISIIADEKAARHQLENLVTTLEGKVNQMSDKINLMERFHVEVEKELLRERNKTEHLESDVAHLKSEVAMLNQKCIDACKPSNASSEINQNMTLSNLSKHFDDLQEGLQRNFSDITHSVIHQNTVMMDNLTKQFSEYKKGLNSNISYQMTLAIDQNRVEMANFTKSFSELKDGLQNNISYQMTSAIDQMANFTEQFSELKGSFKNLSDQTHLSLQQLHSSTPIVAFEAHHLTNLSPSGGERLVFTTVSLNNGSAYNNIVGVFTAPVSGLYQFHVQLCLNNLMIFFVKIKSDSKSLLESLLIDDGSSHAGCNTLSTTGNLKKSEHVQYTQRGFNRFRATTADGISFGGKITAAKPLEVIAIPPGLSFCPRIGADTTLQGVIKKIISATSRGIPGDVPRINAEAHSCTDLFKFLIYMEEITRELLLTKMCEF